MSGSAVPISSPAKRGGANSQSARALSRGASHRRVGFLLNPAPLPSAEIAPDSKPAQGRTLHDASDGTRTGQPCTVTVVSENSARPLACVTNPPGTCSTINRKLGAQVAPLDAASSDAP